MPNTKISFCLTQLLLALMLAGCDSIPFIDTTPDYKTAGRSRPLEVPPDLTSVSSSDVYTVPGSGTTYSEYAEGQARPGEEVEKVLPRFDSVKMERAGSQRWLIVKAPAEKVWPVVREFWTDLGFAVRVENAQSGVMETEWVDPSSLTTDEKGNYLDKFQGWLDKLNTLQTRQKFRSRIDRGAEENTTEIYISHRSVADVHDDGKERVRTTLGTVETGYRNENAKPTKANEARATAEDIDAELMRRLMVKLGVDEGASRTVIASAGSEKRASLEAGKDGYAKLMVNDEFDRAWRRVGLALDRIGFLVEDKNRSRGVFYVRYSDFGVDTPEEKEGFLSKLKFWGDDKKAEQKPEPAKEDKSLTDKLKFWENDKDQTAKEKQYQVTVEEADQGSSNISIADSNGQRDRSATANRILSMLYDQLK